MKKVRPVARARGAGGRPFRRELAHGRSWRGEQARNPRPPCYMPHETRQKPRRHLSKCAVCASPSATICQHRLCVSVQRCLDACCSLAPIQLPCTALAPQGAATTRTLTHRSTPAHAGGCSSSASSAPSLPKSFLATTGVRATVGGKRIGEAALWMAYASPTVPAVSALPLTCKRERAGTHQQQSWDTNTQRR